MQFRQNVSLLPSPVAQPKTLTPEELGSRLDKAFDDLVEKGCLSRMSNRRGGKKSDEMSTEAQAALNKFAQPQVPEQVERDGLESQHQHAVASGTVDPEERFGAEFHGEAWERMRNSPFSTMIRFVGLVTR